MYLSYDPQSRYIPSTRTSNMITNLGLSRIEPTRALTTEMSHNTIPTDDSPFNPIIYDNVKYTAQPYITNINRVISKYENNNPGNNNIALYDTHKYTLNAGNEATMADNQLYKNLMQRARDKIHLKSDDMLPTYGNPNTTNGWNYNNRLPPSETNVIPPNGPIIDPRLTQHTNERAWNYPSTRADIAYDLQRANFIKERNIRQHEADDALLRRTKKNRWVEPKQAYMNRNQNPTYELNTSVIKASSKDNDRNTITAQDLNYALALSRENFTHKEPYNIGAHDYNLRAKYEYSNFLPEFKRGMEEVYDENVLQSRIEQYKSPELAKSVNNSITNRQFGKEDGIHSMFKWNNVGNRNANYNLQNQVDPKLLKIKPQTMADTGAKTTFNQLTKERFLYKPEHVLVIKDGTLTDIYPDDEFNNTATSISTVDPYTKGIIKTVAFLQDGKFILLQKTQADKLFAGDHQRMNDDIISVELPIAQLTKKFRDRVKKYNTSTNRDKPLNLKYDDFIEIIKWVQQHPEKQKRLKKEQLHQRVRTGKYDADIINGFEGKRMFVDNKVYIGLADNARKKFEMKQKGRIEKSIDDYNTVEGGLDVSPLDKNGRQINSTSKGNIEQFGQMTSQQRFNSVNSRSRGLSRGSIDSRSKRDV